jgi:hypothetical protein
LHVPTRERLPEIITELSPAEVLSRAETLSRRGKLPGFGAIEGGFVATAFGEPFDHALSAHVSDGRIRFTSRVKPLLPAAAALIVVITIWPGVWLTDSLLTTYFAGYDYATWMWYLPLTVIPLPWAIRRMRRRSRDAAEESARELIERVREATDGRLESPEGSTGKSVAASK